MENLIVTELVKFTALETTQVEQLVEKAGVLYQFQKQQDGFIDVELVKNVDQNEWYLIYHYESLEKIKVVGEKLKKSKEFGEFIPLIDPESIRVSFYHQLRKD
jgi:heme-degrading monooxygenase HmoA